MRTAARRDDNEPEIIMALRGAGCDVWPLDRPVDLLVGRAGRNYLIEVKDGDKPPSARKLRPGQVEFIESWRGQVEVVHTVLEALVAVGLAKEER